MKTNAIPSFGLLQGVRVVHLTTSVAGPYCACRMADMGADVIWIENPKGMDFMRTSITAEVERRNMRFLSLNTPTEEGKKIFAELLKTTDILIDSFKGQQMAKWGLTDEAMHEINPGLIICHISGFGQSGDPEYVELASYDPIAQAFGCYMIQNGFPDRKPVPAFPVVADYMTAMQTAYCAMAALYRREKNGGIGEVIDAAQYECMMSVQGGQVAGYLNNGVLPQREGSHSLAAAGYGAYTCKDGVDIYTLCLGVGVVPKMLTLLGLEYGSELFPKGMPIVPMVAPGAKVLEEALQKYCDQYTAIEVEQNFRKAGLPCSRIYDYTMAVEDPHYQAREVFTEWTNGDGKTIKGHNIFPKLKNNPGQIWRGLQKSGTDTADILEELGYTAEQVAAFAADKTVILA